MAALTRLLKNLSAQNAFWKFIYSAIPSKRRHLPFLFLKKKKKIGEKKKLDYIIINNIFGFSSFLFVKGKALRFLFQFHFFFQVPHGIR